MTVEQICQLNVDWSNFHKGLLSHLCRKRVYKTIHKAASTGEILVIAAGLMKTFDHIKTNIDMKSLFVSFVNGNNL